MSTTEQPNTPPLTRRQLREIRNTGATSIVVFDDRPEAEAPDQDHSSEVPDEAPVPARVQEHADAIAPVPRPATPVVVPPAPAPDDSVDLGVSPLTRRQARQQERIRTASVPVITPDVAARFAAQSAPVEADTGEVYAAIPSKASTQDARGAAEGGSDVAVEIEAEVDEAEILELVPVEDGAEEASGDMPVLSAEFGAELLAAESAKVELPPTFDQLISRETSSAGSVATPNALILSQTPSAGPLTGPIASTGEVLITGTYDLPEGLGSTGHAPGTADGKEADAVLVDGELPAHSSPTPISASAAISTVKSDGEIIRPPAPEKGNKLMLMLAITAGALALALVGVLILAFVTGVFS